MGLTGFDCVYGIASLLRELRRLRKRRTSTNDTDNVVTEAMSDIDAEYEALVAESALVAA